MNLLSVDRTSAMRPSILLIVMDATRARNLSCYGYHRPTTPRLERFAERCVVYEQAISAGCWSLPGHASIFTGLYPSTHGASDQHQFLAPEHPTMAELLRAYGYRTVALCQKRDVGPFTGLDRGFEWFNPGGTLGSLGRVIRGIDNGIVKVLGQRDKGARHTNRQIRSLLPQLRAGGHPFFMFVSYVESHIPYCPPRKYNRYLPAGVSLMQARQVNQDRWKYMAGHARMDEQDFEILTALYDGEVAYADARVAEILGWLEQLDLLDRMMVIITADHGENLGEHRLMAHGYCLYDTVIHVPLVIHYPRGITSPGRVARQVQTVDLLPTILTMLGDTSSQMYRSLQGYDLLSSTRRDFTIAEQSHPDLTTFHKRFPDVDVSQYGRALKMIRTERYKYIWASDRAHELYDLQADPDEEHNVIAECAHIAADLDWRLTEWRNNFEIASASNEGFEFDKVVKERLRA